MSLGAVQAQGQQQLILQNQLGALPLPNLQSLGAQELQVLQHALQHHQQTLQQQLQHFVLLQQSAAAASPTAASQLTQTTFYLQSQVNTDNSFSTVMIRNSLL